MALNNFNSNCLTPVHFKGLTLSYMQYLRLLV